jgi:hypothetical protein
MLNNQLAPNASNLSQAYKCAVCTAVLKKGQTQKILTIHSRTRNIAGALQYNFIERKHNVTAKHYLVLCHLVLENATVFAVLDKVLQLA